MRAGRIRRCAVLAAAVVTVAGCASFSDAETEFSDQATLIPTIATVVPPYGDAAAMPTLPTEETPEQGAADPGVGDDPCAPPELPIVAVCLDEPVGLAPLPDGASALVAERTSGRILRIAPAQEPELVADLDGAVGGLALSPFFVEDQLVYVYVTTDDDSRVLRLPLGGEPTAIVTDLPHGDGMLAFGPEGLLHIATSAGDILRYDGFGSPAEPNESGTAAFATGLVQVSGFCPLPGARLGVVDHRPTGDALIVLEDGADYTQLRSGDTLWTFSRGDGGAVDCAVADNALLATSRRDAAATRIEMRGPDSFTGVPEKVAEGDFGYLDELVAGPGELVWLTTRNRTTEPALDGFPDPSDDRVLVLPPDMGGGGDGGLD